MTAMNASFEGLKRAIRKVPLVRAAEAQRYERSFAGDSVGLVRGVYGTFAEARRSAPATKPVGFDVPGYEHVHIERMHKIQPYDYSVLYWLRPLIRPGCRVFDFGGNVGLHYYAYGDYLRYPVDLRWTVCELPRLVKVGTAIAAREQAPHLRFTESVATASGADVFLASGALQYVEDPLEEVFARIANKPRHLLVNKVPLYDGDSFVTLQNARVAFVPEHVYNRAAFDESLESLGYRLVDAWDVPGLSCFVPFHPDRSLATLSGLYLRREH
jgi:putative methyltransferase (TIGR04325 family)